MSSLEVRPVFKEISTVIGGDIFSTMYFGKHYGKNLLLLKHEPTTLMLIFGNNDDLLTPEFTKTVSSGGKPIKKAVEIVGSEDIILLLDEDGNLWRLINAGEFTEGEQRLYLLHEKCFYEWAPFRKFPFKKVLAITGLSQGIACIGINGDCEKRLKLLFSTHSEDYTFVELNSGHSWSYYLSNIEMQELKHNQPSSKLLFITDKVSGRSYMCAKGGKTTLLYVSHIPLISTVLFEEEKCLLLCYQNGKLVFNFYNKACDNVIYLLKKISFIKKCMCGDCIVWSDGHDLHHTKIEFGESVKLFEMPVNPSIKGVMSFMRVHNGGIVVSVNNFYYHILGSGEVLEKKVEKQPDELLSDIYQNGLKINELNKRIEKMRDYLHQKEIVQKNEVIIKVGIESEGRFLTLKNNTKTVFKKDFWRVKLLKVVDGKQVVKLEKLELDMNEGLLTRLETPFVKDSDVKVSLVGDFGEELEALFVDLGEIKSERHERKSILDQILAKRKPV